MPFKRLLEMLFALPLPTWTSYEDVEAKALELFHNFTAKKRAPGLENGQTKVPSPHFTFFFVCVCVRPLTRPRSAARCPSG